MTTDAIKMFAHAFINSRLDYCNALYHGISDGLMSRLQSVQNAAARLAMGLSRRDHITPALDQLHWLPVRQRVQFKLTILVYRSLTGTAPSYLSDDCKLTADTRTRSLRSGDSRTCIVRRTHNPFGDHITPASDRCFAVAGPSLWNKLPLHMRLPDISYECRRMLKTFLFRF